MVTTCRGSCRGESGWAWTARPGQAADSQRRARGLMVGLPRGALTIVEVAPPFRWIAASDFHVVSKVRTEYFPPFV